MGIVDRVLDTFFGRDETRDWPSATARTIKLDLRAPSLDGVRIGDPFERLRAFGRPQGRRPSRYRSCLFPALGLIAEHVDRRVVYFGLPLDDDRFDAIGPCRLEIAFPDGCTEAPPWTIERFSAVLGPPASEDTDEEEILTEFELPAGVVLELESELDRQVRRVNLFPRDDASPA